MFQFTPDCPLRVFELETSVFLQINRCCSLIWAALTNSSNSSVVDFFWVFSLLLLLFCWILLAKRLLQIYVALVKITKSCWRVMWGKGYISKGAYIGSIKTTSPTGLPNWLALSHLGLRSTMALLLVKCAWNTNYDSFQRSFMIYFCIFADSAHKGSLLALVLLAGREVSMHTFMEISPTMRGRKTISSPSQLCLPFTSILPFNFHRWRP